jgi:hypothetical protein
MTEIEATPYLDKLSSAAWSRFASEFEAYTARGGKRKIKHLITAAVLKIIELRVPKCAELDGSEFVGAVSKLFAPTSEIEAFDRFKRITMQAKMLWHDVLYEPSSHINRWSLIKRSRSFHLSLIFLVISFVFLL